ncbi:MAG: VanZ family protein [Nanoarchaeota archaeon]
MKKIYYILKSWSPSIMYMAFIYYLSSLSKPLESLFSDQIIFYFNLHDITYHIIEYMVLSFLLYIALKKSSKNPSTFAILITLIYAITDEIHQYFVLGRVSSVFDVAFDSFGAIAMQSIVNIYNYVKNNKDKQL